MDRLNINSIILNKKIINLKARLNGIFDEEPHVYTALALNEMDYPNSIIIDVLKHDIEQHNEAQSQQLNELTVRQLNAIEPKPYVYTSPMWSTQLSGGRKHTEPN